MDTVNLKPVRQSHNSHYLLLNRSTFVINYLLFHSYHVYLFNNYFYFFLYFFLPFADSKYKHEVLLDGEPILFEILDTCPKVRALPNFQTHNLYEYTRIDDSQTEGSHLKVIPDIRTKSCQTHNM